MKKDTLYVDFINGRHEMFTYSDGTYVYIGFHFDNVDCEYYAKVHNYKIVYCSI